MVNINDGLARQLLTLLTPVWNEVFDIEARILPIIQTFQDNVHETFAQAGMELTDGTDDTDDTNQKKQLNLLQETWRPIVQQHRQGLFGLLHRVTQRAMDPAYKPHYGPGCRDAMLYALLNQVNEVYPGILPALKAPVRRCQKELLRVMTGAMEVAAGQAAQATTRATNLTFNKDLATSFERNLLTAIFAVSPLWPALNNALLRDATFEPFAPSTPTPEEEEVPLLRQPSPRTCSICYERPIKLCFRCGHAVCCLVCTNELLNFHTPARCPYCQLPFEDLD